MSHSVWTYQYDLCIIEICLQSWHGVRFCRILELIEISLALAVEALDCLSSGPLCWTDLAGEVLPYPLHEGVGHSGRVLVVRDTDNTQLVRPDEDVAHVLRLLHALPRPHPRPLHQDLGGERDEVLGRPSLEKTDTRQVVASLE